MISKNISFDKELLNDNKQRKNIEIGSLNLDDYNLRMGANHKLTYNGKFIRTVDNPNIESILALRFNDYLSIITTEDFFVDHHIQGVRDRKDEIMNYFEISKRTGKIKKEDYDYTEKSVDLFEREFLNYSPLGFLSDDGVNTIKNQVNEMVKELKTYWNGNRQSNN